MEVVGDPHIGDSVVFSPVAFSHYEEDSDAPTCLSGCVVAVNEAHRHYTVEAELHGYRIRETYKY